MNGAPNKTRTHFCRFASQACKPLYYSRCPGATHITYFQLEQLSEVNPSPVNGFEFRVFLLSDWLLYLSRRPDKYAGLRKLLKYK